MTTTQNTIEQAVHEKESLLATLQGLKSKRSGITAQLNNMQNQLVDARKKVNGYPSDKPEYSYLLEQAKENLQYLLDQESTFEADIQNLSSQIDGINAKLEKFSQSASIEQLLAFTKKIKKAELDVQTIDNKINQQQQLIDSLHDDSEDKLTLLQQKRTSLLAEISLEKANQSDLNKLDDEIAALVNDSSQQHCKDHPIKRDASQLIQGLMPHKQVAEKILSHLKADLPKIVDMFFIGQAEDAAKHYLKASQLLIEGLSKLKAIDNIRSQMNLTSEGSFIVSNPMNLLTIPSMNLKAFKQVEQDKPDQYVLFTPYENKNAKENMVSLSEKDLKIKFENLGLTQVFDLLDS